MSNFFWKYNVSCNAACHASRGVGPATDYEVPWGTPIHAPFAGSVQPFRTVEGGNGIRLVGDEYTFVGQHLAELPRYGNVAWRSIVAKSGNSGTASTGPHIHAYIIIHATGERVSFQKWYEDIINGGDSPAPAPTPAPVNRKFTTREAYWYTSREDANALRNVHGDGNGTDKRYTNEPMAIGTYDVVEDPGDSFAIRANDGSIIWISGLLRNGLS